MTSRSWTNRGSGTLDQVKEAVVRAAQRELDLLFKAGHDAQIAGSFFDIRIEGKYFGWCNKEQRQELQELYDATPSLLANPHAPSSVPPQQVAEELLMISKRCRELEADMLLCGPGTGADALAQVRSRIELLTARISPP